MAAGAGDNTERVAIGASPEHFKEDFDSDGEGTLAMESLGPFFTMVVAQDDELEDDNAKTEEDVGEDEVDIDEDDDDSEEGAGFKDEDDDNDAPVVGHVVEVEELAKMDGVAAGVVKVVAVAEERATEAAAATEAIASLRCSLASATVVMCAFPQTWWWFSQSLCWQNDPQ